MKKYGIVLGNTLNRKELKKIKGGSSLSAPGDPSGTGSGHYKCCWTGTTTCSDCVSCSSSCTCVSGATLTAC